MTTHPGRYLIWLCTLLAATGLTAGPLHAAQDEFGWLDEPTLEAIAAYLGLEPIKVYEAATFYDMFNRAPVGTYNIKVCTNISCDLCGGEEVLDRFLEETGTRPGETSASPSDDCTFQSRAGFSLRRDSRPSRWR